MTGPAPTPWLVYGCRTPYAAEAVEVIWRTGGTVSAMVDNLDSGPEPCALAPVVGLSQLRDRPDLLACPVVIPLLTPGHRPNLEAEARRLGFVAFPALVDPTAAVARTASLGEGSMVNAMAVVAAVSSIGRFVQVNRSASIGHDAEVADFTTFGPGCILAGHVTVETGAFIGAGAVIGPEVNVGANAVVGAGTVVVRDVPAGAVVVGNPAKVLRQGSLGYGGVAVSPAPAS